MFLKNILLFQIYFFCFQGKQKNIFFKKKIKKIKSGQIWPNLAKSGQIWPKQLFGQIWPDLARFGQIWPDLARFLFFNFVEKNQNNSW